MRQPSRHVPPPKGRGGPNHPPAPGRPATGFGGIVEWTIKYIVPMSGPVIAVATALIALFNLLTIQSVNHKAQELQAASVELQALAQSEQQLSADRALISLHSEESLGSFSVNYANASDKPIFVTGASSYFPNDQQFSYDLNTTLDGQVTRSCGMQVWQAVGTTVKRQSYSCDQTFALPADALLFVSAKYDGSAVEASCKQTGQEDATTTVEIDTVPGQVDLDDEQVSEPCRDVDPSQLLQTLGLSGQSDDGDTPDVFLAVGCLLLVLCGAAMVWLRRGARPLTNHRRVAVIVVASSTAAGVTLVVLGAIL